MIKFSTGMFESLLSTDSFAGVLGDGVMCIYSGTQPSSADSEEVGDLLAEVTLDGVAFTPGSPAGGLSFGSASEKSISKATGEVWRGDFEMEGSMGWFRFYSNSKTTGASTSAIRIDGNIGTSRADINLQSTQATNGGSITFDTFTLNFSVIS